MTLTHKHKKKKTTKKQINERTEKKRVSINVRRNSGSCIERQPTKMKGIEEKV